METEDLDACKAMGLFGFAIPEAYGGLGRGYATAMACLAHGRIHIAALCVGMSERLIDESVSRIADRAVQIHGGAGYMRGVAVERFFRDARLFRIYEGASQIQQIIIARELLGSSARG